MCNYLFLSNTNNAVSNTLVCHALNMRLASSRPKQAREIARVFYCRCRQTKKHRLLTSHVIVSLCIIVCLIVVCSVFPGVVLLQNAVHAFAAAILSFRFSRTSKPLNIKQVKLKLSSKLSFRVHYNIT